MTLWRSLKGLVGEPSIFEKGAPGRVGVALPELDFEPAADLGIPESLCRNEDAGLPEVTEFESLRHYTRLSQLNASIDTMMYPLGSCTMKYNPRSCEKAARIGSFAYGHPLEPTAFHQANLRVLLELGDWLAKITGLDAVTLQPAAGAQGELCGLMMIRAALEARGDARRKVIVPDSAHGTNPATSALNGYEVLSIKTGPEGYVRADAVREVMGPDVAAIMITNPNTLGIFEREIEEICQIVHEGGGFVYMDGANLNALLGVAQPGRFGIDVMHINLPKTFSTPHGGGGPGAGPVACVKELEPFLPSPVVVGPPEAPRFAFDRPQSIGKLRSFHGNFGMLIRAHCYISEHGAEGLKQVGRDAILSANYLRARLKDQYNVAYEADSMHEVVFDDTLQKERGVTTLDLAKRLIDFGFHPPPVYFPLIVPGALMAEPTETEPLEELNRFVVAMRALDQETKEHPEDLKDAPRTAPSRRFDEALAARQPRLRYYPPESN